MKKPVHVYGKSKEISWWIKIFNSIVTILFCKDMSMLLKKKQNKTINVIFNTYEEVFPDVTQPHKQLSIL